METSDTLLWWFFVLAIPLHLFVCGLSLYSLRNREFAYLARFAAFPLLFSAWWTSLMSLHAVFIGLGIWMLRDYRAGLTGRGAPIYMAGVTGGLALAQIVGWMDLLAGLEALNEASEMFGIW